jgi:hypothetical protein
MGVVTGTATVLGVGTLLGAGIVLGANTEGIEGTVAAGSAAVSLRSGRHFSQADSDSKTKAAGRASDFIKVTHRWTKGSVWRLHEMLMKCP